MPERSQDEKRLVKCGGDFVDKTVELLALVACREPYTNNVCADIDVGFYGLNTFLRTTHRHPHVELLRGKVGRIIGIKKLLGLTQGGSAVFINVTIVV